VALLADRVPDLPASTHERLRDVLGKALTCAGVLDDQVDHIERGMHHVVVFSQEVDLATVLPALLRQLLAALAGHEGGPRLRVRVAAHVGTVDDTADGTVDTTLRLVDAAETRTALLASPGAQLVLALTDELFQQATAAGPGGLPSDGYQAVVLRDVEPMLGVWLRAISVTDLEPGRSGAMRLLSAGGLALLAGQALDVVSKAADAVSGLVDKTGEAHDMQVQMDDHHVDLSVVVAGDLDIDEDHGYHDEYAYGVDDHGDVYDDHGLDGDNDFDDDGHSFHDSV
jgi:hypothetical protein